MASLCGAMLEAQLLNLKYRKAGGRFELCGRFTAPFKKGTEKFYWFLVLHAKPCTDLKKLLSPSNETQTPLEECHACTDLLRARGVDVHEMLSDKPERCIDVVQVDATNNFLDKKPYKRIVSMEAYKFMKYAVSHTLLPRACEVPKFLGYDMFAYTHPSQRCIELKESKPKTRNQPATLLTLNMKTLTPEVEIFGKAFILADRPTLTSEEVREIVIFCMGQAEALELKLTSWDKLRNTLQDEAKKFAESADHIQR